MFASRRLNEVESRYSSYRLEFCGLVYVVETFRFWVLGQTFEIRTDHCGLQWLMETKHPNVPAQIFRWQQLLTEYDFKIKYVPGSQLKLVDALSRKPHPSDFSDNIINVLPRREHMWENDMPIAQARSSKNEDLWIENMKKRFDPKDECDYKSDCYESFND